MSSDFYQHRLVLPVLKHHINGIILYGFGVCVSGFFCSISVL